MVLKVALLRGVNVGAGRRIAMAELRALAAGLGWRDIRTVIASGNLLFRAEGPEGALASDLEAALGQATGTAIPVLVLPAARMVAAATDCPFAGAPGSRVHGFFLWSKPEVDRSALRALRAPDEALVIGDGLAWLHAPSGIARSALAQRMARVLTGTEMTARNLNTIRKLADLAQAGLD